MLLALALTTGAWMPMQAQTFEQSVAAYERKDYRKAFAGFKKLAAQGYANAQFNLGLMYAEGQVVPRDYQQAYFWWLLAGTQGDKDAAKFRDLVERDFSPAQRAAAQADARNWKLK